jgi:hypothetical protein
LSLSHERTLLTTSSASNVTPITEKQTTPQTKFTIQVTLDGFPIVIEGEGRADSLRALIDRIKAIGGVPPAASPAQATATASTSAGIPRCPIHNAPMKASRQLGKFYCAKKAADGEYCREVA